MRGDVVLDRIDYRELLELADHHGYEVEEVVKNGLVGNGMAEFIEETNQYGYLTDIKLRDRRFEDGEIFGDVFFKDLIRKEYDFSSDDYHFSMRLYEFRGVVILGRLNRANLFEDFDMDIQLEGIDDDEDTLNKVMLYVIDEIRHLL